MSNFQTNQAQGLPERDAALAICPQWISAHPAPERTALIAGLKNVIELDPDIAMIEQRHRLLERFSPVRDALAEIARQQSKSVDQLYSQLLISYGSIASYAALYTRLFAQRLIDPAPVKNLLDLGPGHWNSACVYEEIFPQLTFALGIESDKKKRDVFVRDNSRLLKPSEEVFQMVAGNFFQDLGAICSAPMSGMQRNHKPFDLALMQSYYPNTPHNNDLYSYAYNDPRSPREYRELLHNIGNQLTPEGKLVLSLDCQDLRAVESLVRLAEILIACGAQLIDDQRLARHSWGMLVALPMKVFVISGENLVQAN